MPNPPLIRPESIVVRATDGSVITFDRAGRLYSAFLDGRFYRRGVFGAVVEKYTADKRTIRRRLAPPDAANIVALALERAGPVEGRLTDLEADGNRFRDAYGGPIPILPPDVYRALVLQATVGCKYNACLFCSFYRDRPFRVRGVHEFGQHTEAVAEAFGAGLSMRRGVFLGDADALVADTDTLLGMCARARRLPPAGAGLFCFGAIFGEPARSKAEWEALKDAGLRRVYLGIETGHDPLRRRMHKPGTSREALGLVASLKEAGIGVGLIFLLGAGGRAFEREHVRDSAAFCRAAHLDSGDFAYLSPLVSPSGRLPRNRFEAQAAALRDGIGAGPRVAVYDIRAFIY